MPELPEVETTVRGIRDNLVGHTIKGVWLDWANGLYPPDPELFTAQIVGQKIIGVQRRAKYIVIQLEHDWLLIHLKMTGVLYVVPVKSEQRMDKWVHFRFQLDNGNELRFSDSRKFGRVYLINSLDKVLAKIGPEPLEDEFTLEAFKERLKKRSGKIKPLLLNQAFLAGVGNIYADEALHLAQIHPVRLSNSLTEQEIEALHEAIRHVLMKGIERQGASVNWYRNPDGEKGTMQEALYVYNREGQLCLTCGQGNIVKMVVGQRGTHYCPICQKEGEHG